MERVHRGRGLITPVLVASTVWFGCLGLVVAPGFFCAALVFGALLLLGIYDLTRAHHSISRNYPLLGCMC